MRALRRFTRGAGTSGSSSRWFAGRRRRTSLLLIAVVVPVLAVYLIGTAFGSASAPSVQYNDSFELDGNATAGDGLTSATPPVPNSHDWVDVFNQCQTDCLANPGGIDGANVRTFKTDLFNSSGDDTYTGGSTKDGLGINGWKWNEGSAPPAKDDLEHAYAAQYNSAKECADANLNTFCVNHQLVFFGTDRYSNGGDSDVGFWFLQGQVAPNEIPPKSNSTGFSGNHTNGDVLVLSTFQNGGVVPQVAVYKWVCTDKNNAPLTGADCDGPAPAHSGETIGLSLVGSSNGADCVNGVDTHGRLVPANSGPFCATVNTGSVSSPWSFTEKASDGPYVAPSSFGPGTFFEGGIDLTNLGFANECFSSFITESRSSQSTTAVLEDFVAGQFAPCRANISTTPSTTGSVAPQTAVHDTAQVVGNQATKYPSGTVTFSLCGPEDTITSCESTDSTIKTIGTGSLVSDTTTDATSNATSPSVNCASTSTSGCSGTAGTSPLSPGHYCFRATWPGDNNYTDPLPRSGETETDECFDVTVIPTDIATTQFFYPNDHATVSTGTGNLPAGSVEFKLYGPTSGGNTALQNCQANGTTVGSGGLLYRDPSETINGTSASQTVSSSNTTVRVPDDVTSLYWRVTYTISPANPAYAASNSACVENTSYSQGSGDTDTATITNDKTAHP